MSEIIERPDVGTIIRISCRKYSGPNKVRQTQTHHAFEFDMKGNVTVSIERVYTRNRV